MAEVPKFDSSVLSRLDACIGLRRLAVAFVLGCSTGLLWVRCDELQDLPVLNALFAKDAPPYLGRRMGATLLKPQGGFGISASGRNALAEKLPQVRRRLKGPPIESGNVSNVVARQTSDDVGKLRECLTVYGQELNRIRPGLGDNILTHPLSVPRTSHRPLVFGVGEGTTGTRGLFVALKMLGWKKNVWHYRLKSKWLRDSMCNLDTKRRTQLKLGCHAGLAEAEHLRRQRNVDLTDNLPDQIYSILDNPVPNLFVSLFLAFPQARYILTTREAGVWAKSRLAYHKQAPCPMQEPVGCYVDQFDEETLGKMVKLQDNLVRCTVPKDRLFEMDVVKVPKEESWQLWWPLQRFLGLTNKSVITNKLFKLPFGRTPGEQARASSWRTGKARALKHKAVATTSGSGDHHTFRNSPTVYLGILPARADLDCELAALKRCAWRVKDRSDARFDFKCCLRKDNIDDFEKLPQRSAMRPYLIWAHGRVGGIACLPQIQDPRRVAACSKLEQFMLRKDVLFVGFDLRDPWLQDDKRTPLPGVTMAPPKYYDGIQHDPNKLPDFFMTFRGQMIDGWYESAHVRSDLKRAFDGLGRKDVLVESLPRNKTYHYTTKDKARYAALLNTAYALVPHGDGRWNYRFSEVIGACAIPVVIADGISWPYSEIIDWSEAAVWISEDFKTAFNFSKPLHRGGRRLASNPKLDPLDLLSHLPTQPEVIQRMRRRVCQINEQYFKTPDKRWAALLRSAAIRVRAAASPQHQ